MEEQGAKCKKAMLDWNMKKQQTETEDQGAKRKKTMQECVTKQQQTETEEQGAKRKMAMLDYNKKNDRLKRRTKVLNARRQCENV